MLLGLSASSARWGQGSAVHASKVPDSTPGNTKALANVDMVKLFNNAQQNMLELNKQRLIAVEDLKRSERDKELLLARVAQLEAESQAVAAERDVLECKLRTVELVPSTPGHRDFKKGTFPMSIWSELLQRIDTLAMTGSIRMDQARPLRRLVLSRDVEAAEFYDSLSDRQLLEDRALAKEMLKLLDHSKRQKLHIIHICTEMYPVVVSGNLASCITSLSRALQRKGHLVEVFLPKFASMDLSHIDNLKEMNAELHSYFGGASHRNKLWTGVVQGVPVTLFDPLHPNNWFSRPQLYDYEDDFERFSYFSRAALEYLLKSGKQPNILHLHNWQTAIVAPLFWDIYCGQGLGSTRILFTCHSFKSQCKQEPHKLALCGLDPPQLHRPDRLQDNLEPRYVNILKGGIVYSNYVTTVSPIYAKDVMTREHGHGLDPTLVSHMNKFSGIFHGLDETTWNPAHDILLPWTYSVNNLSGKARCKEELRQFLSLPASDTNALLIGCIVTHVSELELGLIKAALDCALEREVQFLFVGTSKNPRIQLILEDLQRDCKTLNAAFALKYNDALVHLVLAASDVFICASVLEPTDQSPLIAMKYGAIPVTRKIPGQHCSVIDVNDTSQGVSKSTGFTFYNNTPAEMCSALSRALDFQSQDPEGWSALRTNGMVTDVSWNAGCAEGYISAYRSICT